MIEELPSSSKVTKGCLLGWIIQESGLLDPYASLPGHLKQRRRLFLQVFFALKHRFRPISSTRAFHLYTHYLPDSCQIPTTTQSNLSARSTYNLVRTLNFVLCSPHYSFLPQDLTNIINPSFYLLLTFRCYSVGLTSENKLRSQGFDRRTRFWG